MDSSLQEGRIMWLVQESESNAQHRDSISCALLLSSQQQNQTVQHSAGNKELNSMCTLFKPKAPYGAVLGTKSSIACALSSNQQHHTVALATKS
jgi:hypothetical protein